MSSKKALICGISGQDGAYLTRFLLDKGYEVYGTSRNAETSSLGNLKTLGIFHHVRVESMVPTDFRSVVQILRKSLPDEIYNLAGQSSVGLSFERPMETIESITLGTLNLLEAVRSNGYPVRVYSAGSSECFGDTGGVPAEETTPFRPRSPYGVGKSAAFWEVANYREAYKLFACTGLTFNHESPLRPQQFVTRKIISAASRIAKGDKEKLRLGNLSVRRDWGWAPEYVCAMWLLLQQSQPDDFVIATGESNRLEDFVAAAFACVGLDWREHVVVEPGLMRPTDFATSEGNPAKARIRLGWQARYRMRDVVRMMMEVAMDGDPQL